jgi:hypothetical protein
MLSLLIQAAQQAQQVVPDVHITLQQPVPSGMSEWTKTIISAGIGAVFGISGNIAMEYVKPIIQRRAIARQLVNEMLHNYSYAVAANEILAENNKAPIIRKHAIVIGARRFLSGLDPQRFKYFTGNQQSVVFEIRKIESLTDFYMILTMAGTRSSNRDTYEATFQDLAFAIETGEKFLLTHSPKYKLDLAGAKQLLSISIEMGVILGEKKQS